MIAVDPLALRALADIRQQLQALGARPGHAQRVLRLWATPVLLQPAAQPLWIGTVHELQFTQQLDFVSYWQAQPGEDALLDGLRADATGLDAALDPRSDDAQRVLRLRPSPP